MTFSVLMATYAKEQPEFLNSCLDSLARQTLSPGEILLVKDGPLTDELEDVLQAHSSLPLRTVSYDGSGQLGGALSLGVQECKFETVARMDSDDIARTDRFERQFEMFNSMEVAVLGGQIEEFNREPGDFKMHRIVPTSIGKQAIWYRNPLNHMTVMFSRTAVLNAGNYVPVSGFEDWYLWLRMYKKGAKLMNMENVLVDARVGNNFLGRRSGVKYAVVEYNSIARFYHEGLISRGCFLKSVAMRFPVRMLPRALARIVYTRGLRES